MKSTLLKTSIILSLVIISFSQPVDDTKIFSLLVKELILIYEKNQSFASLIDEAIANADTLTLNYPSMENLCESSKFSWHSKKAYDLFKFFDDWLKFIPCPENSFQFYEIIYTFAEGNKHAVQFLSTEPGLGWTKKFVMEHGKLMDSKESIVPAIMEKWKEKLGNKWDEFIIPEGGYKSFNEFFFRMLIKPRPVDQGENVVVSPVDGLINIINNNIGPKTQINTKFNEYLDIKQLLNNSQYADDFIGGTAVSCILLPDVYHHYHSPVDGNIIESRIIDGIYFGMGGDFKKFMNQGNIGGNMAKYGVFANYHRGYFIIQTMNFGKVAMIPVGLDDISSIRFDSKFQNITEPKSKNVNKGERLGAFAYGGSMVILIFEKGILGGLKLDQGAKLGIMNIKKTSSK